MSLPLVVVIYQRFCVEDVLGPRCLTCSRVCWCAVYSVVLCGSHTSRGARAIVQSFGHN